LTGKNEFIIISGSGVFKSDDYREAGEEGIRADGG